MSPTLVIYIFMCVCACSLVRVCLVVCARVLGCVCTRACSCLLVRARSCVHECLLVCAHACVCAYVHMFVHMCTCLESISGGVRPASPPRHDTTAPEEPVCARASIRLSLFLYYELLTRTCLSGSSFISSLPLRLPSGFFPFWDPICKVHPSL